MLANKNINVTSETLRNDSQSIYYVHVQRFNTFLILIFSFYNSICPEALVVGSPWLTTICLVTNSYNGTEESELESSLALITVTIPTEPWDQNFGAWQVKNSCLNFGCKSRLPIFLLSGIYAFCLLTEFTTLKIYRRREIRVVIQFSLSYYAFAENYILVSAEEIHSKQSEENISVLEINTYAM